MTAELPYSLTVDGVEYPINTDFRDVFDIFTAFNAPDLSPSNKQFAMLEILYGDDIPQNANEAAKQAVWFLDGGDVIKSETPPPKTMDYEQDAPLLFSAINRVAGYELRDPKIETHWFTFLAFAAEISQDSPISNIVHIRHKYAKGEKLEKHEWKYYRENKHLIDFKSGADNYENMMSALRGE